MIQLCTLFNMNVFQQTIANWRTVFLLAVGIYVFGLIWYVVFASGKIQPWNYPKEKTSHPKNEKLEGA